MFKKFLILASILMLSLTAACSAQTASTSGNGQTGTTLGQIADPTNLSVKDKLGIGILSLDESGLSITSDQAAALLPLWQAVQSLGSDQSAASAEIAALYTQIQEALTANQIAQIENLTWSQTQLVNLIGQYQSLTSQNASAARPTASPSSQGRDMGGGPGGAMLPPDGGIMMGGGSTGMTAGQNTTGETQQSLIDHQTSAKNAQDLNVLLAPAVINLLQQQTNS